MTDLIAPPVPEIILADGSTFTPGKGGAGSPELAFMTPDGRMYLDPLPWCPLLGSLGVREEGFEVGATFPSVTTRLQYLPKDQLIKWYALEAAQCAARTPWVLPRFGERIAVNYWKTAPERTRDQAGERGSLIHDIAEDGDKVLHQVADDLLAGRHPDPWFVERSQSRDYVKALCKFFAAYPGIRPIWVEVTVFSRSHGVAGTLDLIAWVPRLGFVLLDWKTSRTVRASYSFQMCAYRCADYGIVDGRRVPLPKVDASYVVHLGPGEPDPQTGECPGMFEVVPMDNDPGQLAIYQAMDIVARWDHPSRIGAPLPDPSTDGLTGTVYGIEMPPVTFLTAEEAAATVVAKDDALFASALDGYQPPAAAPESAPEQEQADIEALAEARVEEAWADVIMAERAWVAEQIGIIEGAAAQGNVTAQYCSQQLATWWVASGLPMPTDPEFGTSDEHEARYLELLDGLQAATDQLEAPFAPRPQRPDLRELFDRFVAEEQERRAQRPKATMDDLGRLLIASQRGVVGPIEGRAFVLARRGQSISPDEWGAPADPAMAEACAELRERARQLPTDILRDLDVWARENGVPNIMSPQLTAEQLEVITARVEQAFLDWEHRQQTAKAALADVVTDEDLEEIGRLLLTTAGPADLIRDASADQLRRFTLLCAAVERGDLSFGLDADERLILSIAATEADLVSRWGSKKAVRDAARAAHIALDLKLPRSTADILADPLMVAAVGVGPSDEQEDEAA